MCHFVTYYVSLWLVKKCILSVMLFVAISHVCSLWKKSNNNNNNNDNIWVCSEKLIFHLFPLISYHFVRQNQYFSLDIVIQGVWLVYQEKIWLVLLKDTPIYNGTIYCVRIWQCVEQYTPRRRGFWWAPKFVDQELERTFISSVRPCSEIVWFLNRFWSVFYLFVRFFL